MDKHDVINDFRNFVGQRLDIAHKKLTTDAEYKRNENNWIKMTQELRKCLPPEQHYLLESIHAVEREREYLSSLAAYEQALQDVQDLTLYFKRGQNYN